MSIEQKIRSDVEAILGPNGLAIQQGKRFNQNQLDYALNVASGLGRIEGAEQTQINAQQAATGTGKTLGYLIPLMSYCVHAQGHLGHANRVAVSTYTRYLQRQILDEDAQLAITWIEAVTGQRLTVALRVGMQNHLSLYACTNLLDSFKNDAVLNVGEHIGFLEAVIEHLQGTTECLTIDDYLQIADVDVLPERIERARIGLRSTAPEEEINRYKDHIDKTKSADVLITNHALSVLNAWGFQNFLDDEDRRTTACVFDEADRLDDMCRSMVSSEVSIHALKKLIERLAGKKETFISTANIEALYQFLVSLYKGSGDRFKRCDDTDGEGTIIAEFLDAVVLDLEGFRKLITDKKKRSSVASQLKLAHVENLDYLDADAADAVEQIKAVRKMMKAPANQSAEDQGNSVVVSWSPVKTYPSLRVGRVFPGQILSPLWRRHANDNKQLRGIVFTSATLTGISVSDGDLKELFVKHGLKVMPEGASLDYHIQSDLLKSFEPDRFGSLSFVLADPTVNRPTRRREEEGEYGEEHETDPEWLKYCASMILSASKRSPGTTHPGGRTLVLATSYADTESLAELLGDLPGLFVHKKGKPLTAYLRDFKADENAILITPGAWEGLDMPGMVKNLVIARMPFPKPNSIENQLRLLAGRYAESRLSVQDAIRIEGQSTAIRKLKQGIGRAIRSYEDSATLWIADPRFPRMGDGSKGVSSLQALKLKNSNPSKPVKILARAVPKRFSLAHEQAKTFKKSGVIV